MSEARWGGLDREALLGLLRQMIEIRLFEDEVMKLFQRNLVRASTHLCQGQEAVPVGACSALEPGDTMTCTYRGHGAVLAMGTPLDRSMAEILGKERGVCAGRGGSMHLADLTVGAMGSFAVVGSHLPFACGTGLAAQVMGTGSVSVCFFGDGTTNIGAFHEALNLASVWKLPVVFVCENNLYGEYSPIASTTPVTELWQRAASYAMPSARVDGNDVLAVRAAVASARARAAAEEGPTMIEAMTYRHMGHSRSDPAAYRPEGELERWMQHDPIATFAAALPDHDAISEDDVEAVRHAAAEAVAGALERALSWPEPEPGQRFDHVWAAPA
jgi:acetoin:2,6-dichlorophenolindophenol oxidoreductase subunit alpha